VNDDPNRAAADMALEIWQAEERQRYLLRAQERRLVGEVEQFLMTRERSDDGYPDDGGSDNTEPNGHPED